MSKTYTWPTLYTHKRKAALVLTTILIGVAIWQALPQSAKPTEPPVQTETLHNRPLSRTEQSVPAPTMIQIPAGQFTMGCTPQRNEVEIMEGGCADDETPAHEVHVPTFWLSETEVTVGQYMACVKAGVCPEPEWQAIDAPSYYPTMGETLTGENYPIVGVSWENAQTYLQWLSQQSVQRYRLPTEAEWEYAARAKTDTAYPWGNSIGKNNANCSDDGCGETFTYTSPVGSFAKNSFGLADMHGNVWEWVEDCYIDNYKDAPIDGSAHSGCNSAASRVLRGGSWFDSPLWLRSMQRSGSTPHLRFVSIGFRAAKTINSFPFMEGGSADQLASTLKEEKTPPSLPFSGEELKAALPRMVKIPAGQFTMGCDPKRDEVEGGCNDDEKPAHEVNVPTFWLSESEVTVGQYMACVKADACPEPEWQEQGSDYNIQTGKDNHYKEMGGALTGDNYPIVGISWQNAQTYLQWLSKQTKNKYRLPTEAEWEYAARAATDTVYPWGNSIGKNNANCSDDKCGETFTYTSPVGSFAKNSFGLADMHGNVWEWVEDCYIDNYKNVPIDGSARPGCNAGSTSRMLRGGSWFHDPLWLRSAFRNYYYPPYSRFNIIGFRAARTD